MTLVDYVALTGAGLAAGMASAMVGGASLISFPILLGFGLPPLTANVTNTCGLVPTAIGAALASRPELRGQLSQVVFLAIPAIVGSLIGVTLLLAFPASTFEALVPFLIAISSLLVAIQPWLLTRVGERLMSRNRGGLWTSTLIVSCYGGYFGAAAAVLFLGLAGLFSTDTMHQLNALKNVLMGVTNAVAMVAFTFLAAPMWPVVAALAIGSLMGGAVGMRLVRFVPARVLRMAIGVMGISVALWIGLS
jgi:uncharacterized membrane protein YfcA